MRAVRTIRSAVKADGTSLSGICTVTGTTARASLHSIMTGCGRLAGFRRQGGEVFGMAGMAKAGGIEHVLGDRVGDDRAGAPLARMRDRGGDRFNRRSAGGRVRPPRSGRDAGRERHDGKRPREDLRCFLG